MILKDATRQPSLLAVSEKLRQDHRARFWSRLAVLFIISACGAFVLGAYLNRSGYLTETLEPAIARNTIYLPKKVHALFAKPDVESITIDIKHKDFMKLAYDREIALANGVLFTSEEDFVNGEIRHKDKTYKVSLRLKGDEPDHYSGDKWSFRVNMKGEHSLFGMKRFSLQHPKTRNFVYEWILHQALKMEGLIYHRYLFVDVIINGKDMGIYALEEHMDKRLIEHNQRREGPILKFSEVLIWKELVEQIYEFHDAAWNGNGAYTASDIEAFQMSRWVADAQSALHLKKAVSLLDAFRTGELSTSEVFDVDKLATYFAVMDLFGCNNGTQWTNIRFYYNPVTSRLEPIGRDGSAEPLSEISAVRASITSQYDTYNRRFYSNLFGDAVFYRAYVKELERLSEPAYLDGYFSKIEEDLNYNLLTLYSEFPEFSFSKDLAYQNQRYIRSVLNPVKGFHAHLQKSGKDRITIELGNIQSLPVEVVNAAYKDTVLLQIASKGLLSPFQGSHPVSYQQMDFELPANFVWSDTMAKHLKINYRLLGANRLRQEQVMPPRDFESKFVDNDFVRRQPNVYKFDFIVTNAAKKEIFIKPGSWTLNTTLIIPKGFRVVCGPGTSLNLTNSASILSFSPLEFVGREDFPITIQSRDSTGHGLVVMTARAPSMLTHVTFKNLSNPVDQGWELTGAVTFYESDAQFLHCQFLNNRSEDGLNVIRSEFNMDHSLFSGTSSDAFDGDFIKGTIANTSFVNCGNDGVDVSGSLLEIRDVRVNGSGDKGLSNGENSQMHATNVDIKNAEIAVASKDISLIQLRNVSIFGGQIGLTAYQKKAEFGPGTIHAHEVRMQDVPIPYLVEARSEVQVDDVAIAPSRDNVKDILYGVEYGKASKPVASK
jgi:hypothetical protein